MEFVFKLNMQMPLRFLDFTVDGYFFFSVHSPATKNNMLMLFLVAGL